MTLHNYEDANHIPTLDNNVLVFGSNVDGWHGAGVAKIANDKFGATYGNPAGRQGMAFAIRTKDLKVKKHPSVSPSRIIEDIRRLYAHAIENPTEKFYVPYTATGVNLNFYSAEDMAGFFVEAADSYNFPDNVIFNRDFAKLMEFCYERS